MGAPSETISVARDQQLARFRLALRDFLLRAESAARESELTPAQYMLLLLIKGAPDGGERRRFVDLSRDLSSSRLVDGERIVIEQVLCIGRNDEVVSEIV